MNKAKKGVGPEDAPSCVSPFFFALSEVELTFEAKRLSFIIVVKSTSVYTNPHPRKTDVGSSS